MARLLGIDIRSSSVRVAVVRRQYKGYRLEALQERALGPEEGIEDCVRATAGLLSGPGDHVSTGVSGEQLFVRELTLPRAAEKQLTEVVPFEIEALVPVEMDELVYNFRPLPAEGSTDTLRVLAVAARAQVIRSLIETVEGAVGVEPEHVGAGPLELANLSRVCPALEADECVAIVELGGTSSDLVVLNKGVAVFARTLSAGVESLAKGSRALVAGLRQSLAALAQQRELRVGRLYLTSSGVEVEGAVEGLSEALQLPVGPLPKFNFVDSANLDPDGFEKAISLALGQGAGAGYNLRSGALAYQHGFEFVRGKLPLLAALLAVIALSFGFSVWARSRSLAMENEALSEALASVSEGLFEKQVREPQQAMDLLIRAQVPVEKDPEMPLDAFDVLVGFTKAVSDDIIHDIEEFDVQRGKVSVRGMVSTKAEAEQLVEKLSENPCFQDVKNSKITQVMRSDRQRYSMTFEVDCARPKAGSAKGGQ